MRLALKIVAGVLGVVVLAVIGVAIYVSTLDFDDLKHVAAREVKSATGRDLAIDGALDLEISFAPRLSVSGVRFQNAGWGSEPEMVRVGELELVLDMVDLLAGRIDVQRLLLHDVEVLLEEDAGGRGNWEIDVAGRPDATNSGRIDPESVPALKEVRLERIRVRVKDGTETRTYAIAKLDLAADGRDTPIALSAEADIDGREVEIESSLPALARLLSRTETWPVELRGTLDGREVGLAATVEPRWSDAGLDRIALTDLNARFGDTVFRGAATLSETDIRPRIEATLTSEAIDVDDLAGDAGGGGDPMATPLPYELLGHADADLSLQVGRLVADDITIEDLRTPVALKDGVLTIGPGTGRFGGGALAFTNIIDGGAVPGEVRTEGSLKDADFGALAAAHGGRDEFRGRGDAAWKLSGRGATPGDILASSDGFSSLVVREGVIDNDYWELIAEDLAKQIVPFLEGDDRGTLNCIASRFTLRQGVATSDVLLIDSRRVTLAGEGAIDLRDRTIRMRLTPKPADPSLFSLATPILIEGPLDDPSIGPDPIGVAKGVGALALGTVNPLALALPLVSLGADDDACPVAISIAEGRGIPESARKSAGDQVKDAANGAGDAIKGAAEGAGKAVKGLFDKLKSIGD